ncbi:hypothetical protein HDV00_000501 [Rhizophlyctis rosea]|nr:hypothetical protein HDV00_000501 [Rhizophlyctis rosea]
MTDSIVVKAGCVLCFLSDDYVQRKICVREYFFARQLGVPVLPILTTKSQKWLESDVGVSLGFRWWGDLSSAESVKTEMQETIDGNAKAVLRTATNPPQLKIEKPLPLDHAPLTADQMRGSFTPESLPTNSITDPQRFHLLQLGEFSIR